MTNTNPTNPTNPRRVVIIPLPETMPYLCTAPDAPPAWIGAENAEYHALRLRIERARLADGLMGMREQYLNGGGLRCRGTRSYS